MYMGLSHGANENEWIVNGYGGCIVSRIEAKGDIDVELDVNTDIYPMEKDAYYSMVIASSVNADES